MKILMFGRGVIATTYGWALEAAGHEVEFYVRPGRSATYGESIELDILDARRAPRARSVSRTWSPRYREDLPADHEFDLIVVSVAHDRLAAAAEFLAPRLGDATVLIFGNIWAEPREAIAPIPLERVAWGFPGAGGGFDAAGRLRVSLMASVTFGTIDRPASEREREARHVFRSAGFRIAEQRDFRGWVWLHVALDAGMYTQALRLGSLSDLIGRPRALRQALLATRELLPVVAARGVDLSAHRGATSLVRAPSRLAAAVMSFAILHLRAARISLEMHSDPSAVEPRAVCHDVLAKAGRLGVATPRLSKAVEADVWTGAVHRGDHGPTREGSFR